ncbi:hypothetical protein [Pseudaminobacter soli (ex Li et al. 2025)]|uniref:hypothetical protein n=1 Tax=Pseudaminobacter soli (ex Li et al. 2025) TaxID=1295366 RepID=UPI0024761210|nr:hypothetical protein [Mesorhizobium soli]
MTHDSAAETFTMTKGAWTNTYPISDLSKWINFYRLQRERFPAYATYYDDDVTALEKLAATIHRL